MSICVIVWEKVPLVAQKLTIKMYPLFMQEAQNVLALKMKYCDVREEAISGTSYPSPYYVINFKCVLVNGSILEP